MKAPKAKKVKSPFDQLKIQRHEYAYLRAMCKVAYEASSFFGLSGQRPNPSPQSLSRMRSFMSRAQSVGRVKQEAQEAEWAREEG